MKYLIAFALCIHFSILSLGMFYTSKPLNPHLHEFRLWYQRITGAGGSFGFFSPDIGKELEVKFEITDANGKKRILNWPEGLPRDVSIRIGNMVRLIQKQFKNEKVVRSIAASFSASILRRYPDSKSVRVRFYLLDFPNLDDFSIKDEIKKTQIYAASFRPQRQEI